MKTHGFQTIFTLFFILLFPALLVAQETNTENQQIEKEPIFMEMEQFRISGEMIEKDRLGNFLMEYQNPIAQRLRYGRFASQGFFAYDDVLYRNLFFSSYHGSEIYSGLGGISIVHATVSWQAAKGLLVSGGAYVAKMVYHPSQLSPLTDAGVNLDIQYMINDRLALHTFGNYSITNRTNRNIPFLFPQNTIGGGAKVMISDHFGMEGGVLFQSYNGRMRPGVYAAPVFKAGNVKIRITPNVSVGR